MGIYSMSGGSWGMGWRIGSGMTVLKQFQLKTNSESRRLAVDRKWRDNDEINRHVERETLHYKDGQHFVLLGVSTGNMKNIYTQGEG